MNFKFVHNGNCWWLKITDNEHLSEYIKSLSPCFKDAVNEVKNHKKEKIMGHYTNDISNYINFISATNKEPEEISSQRLKFAQEQTYLKVLHETGKVYINSLCGCCADVNEIATIITDNTDFPCFSEKDIVIKTFENEDLKNGIIREHYKYHYYVFLGNNRLTDKNKEKFDTEKEAKEFVKNLFPI